MKRQFAHMAMLLGLLLGLAGCSSNNIEQAVDIVGKQCPMELGNAGEIKSVYLDNNQVLFIYVMNEDLFHIESLQLNPDASKYDIKMLLSNADANIKNLLDAAIAADMPIKFVFEGQLSRKKAEMTLTMDEMRECYRNCNLEPQEKLYEALDATNLLMPIKVSDDMTIDKVMLDGETVVYVYVIANEMADLEQFAKDKEFFQEDLRHNLHDMGENDPAFRAFMIMIANAGKNLAYRYVVGKDKKYADIVVTNKELRPLLHMEQ